LGRAAAVNALSIIPRFSLKNFKRPAIDQSIDADWRF